MNRPAGQGSVMWRLIAKDLYLYRWLIAAALLVGLVALPVMRLGPGDGVSTGINLGMILFITTVITLGIFIAMAGILKERQDGALLFVLSLPISPKQYAVAKVAAALLAFLLPWLALTVVPVILIAASDAPDGGIPSFVAMMTFFLANFCVLLALVLATMSERWAIAGLLITNLCVPAFLGIALGLPGIAEHRQAAVAVWNPTVLTLIAALAGVAVLSLAIALCLRSRRNDLF